MENFIDIISINDLLKKRFFIPSYQRGYRWKEKQVQQLIDDIDSFIPTEANPFYFLQALAVANDSDNDRVNVVDGQQRLTTLQLILGEDCESINIDYAIDKPLDRHFRNEANKIIRDKLGEVGDKRRANFCDKLLRYCKFLYYEVEKDKELETFDKLNSGKIPVKDSELVKCVMLTLGNDEPYDLTNSRANEWDEMERKLYDDSFFAFMTPKDAWREDDRMTILLRYAGLVPSKEVIKKEVYPFLSVVQDNLRTKSRATVWKQIYTAYYRLAEWYNDSIMYHAFGAFVHKRNGKPIASIVDGCDIITEIEKMAIDFEPSPKNDDFNEWRYPLFNYLLLANVAYCWKRWPMRYSFEKHRQVESWSMEHIFARNQRDLNDEELKEWLGDTVTDEKIEEYKAKCNEGMGNEWLADKLKAAYPVDEDNSIRNLALLPKNANSSLNNKLFEGKRAAICSWANAKWTNYWVPPLTEAVFMKSIVGSKMSVPYWSDEHDKPAYEQSMANDIKDFINELKSSSRL